MEKEFIPYKQALELKELGFDEPCFTYYFEDTREIRTGLSIHINNGWTYSGTKRLETILAPLYQQAFRWFREKYNLVHEIQFGSGKIWIRYGVNSFVRTLELDTNNDEFYNTYEDAELACLDKLIEMVKEK